MNDVLYTRKTHTCHIDKTCSCSTTALEPDEYCPIHGGCLETWPPKCSECGRFFKLEKLLDFLGAVQLNESHRGN